MCAVVSGRTRCNARVAVPSGPRRRGSDHSSNSAEYGSSDPLTSDEYDAWVQTMGNRCTGIEKVREIFATKKIERWFKDQGGSVELRFMVDPVTFDIFQACARKHPPSNFECPGISMETAQLVIATFKALMLLLPQNSNSDCGKSASHVECSYSETQLIYFNFCLWFRLVWLGRVWMQYPC